MAPIVPGNRQNVNQPRRSPADPTPPCGRPHVHKAVHIRWTNGGRTENFWGSWPASVDNPVDSKIPLDQGKRDVQSGRRTGKRTPTGARGTASSEWCSLRGVASSEGPTGLTRWKRGRWGIIRYLTESEPGNRGTIESGAEGSAPGNRGDEVGGLGRSARATGPNELATLAQPNRATGAGGAGKANRPPERKL